MKSHARRVLLELQQEGIESIAICLLHAYKNPMHEQRLLQIAQELGMAQLSLSHVVAPLIKAVARGETTVIDAYLGPIIRAYLGRICDQLGGEQNTDLKVMTSAGGLVDFRAYQGKDSILSDRLAGSWRLGRSPKPQASTEPSASTWEGRARMSIAMRVLRNWSTSPQKRMCD